MINEMQAAVFSGLYDASLDGENLQAEAAEEQDPRQGEEVKIGEPDRKKKAHFFDAII